MVDLTLTLGRIALKNPVLVASGTFGYVREMGPFVRIERLGGVIPKTVTFKPRAGNPTPRTAETASGLLNAIGLDNDGIAALHYSPPSVPAHGRHGGDRQHRRGRRRPVRRDGRDAGLGAGPRGDRAEHLVPKREPWARSRDRRLRSRQARAAGSRRPCALPIIAKLTPNVTDIVPIAEAAAEAGADAVSLINTIRGMAVDWRRRRPILAYDVGGLSGPAIKPIALRMVWEVAKALPGLPIIGIGGIATADDALEFLVAGASAVQVGTATFYDPTASERMIDDLTSRLDEAGVTDVRQIDRHASIESGMNHVRCAGRPGRPFLRSTGHCRPGSARARPGTQDRARLSRAGNAFGGHAVGGGDQAHAAGSKQLGEQIGHQRNQRGFVDHVGTEDDRGNCSSGRFAPVEPANGKASRIKAILAGASRRRNRAAPGRNR